MERFDRMLDNLKEEDLEAFKLKDAEKFEKLQREKTEEEIELINYINSLTNDLRKKYGLSERNITPEEIFIIKESSWPYQDCLGITNSGTGIIGIVDKNYNIPNFATILHEVIHVKSYKAMQELQDPEDSKDKIIAGYRNGMFLRSRNGKNEYFNYLNECITDEVTRDLLEEFFENNNLLKSEYGEMKKDFPNRLLKANWYRNALLDNFSNPGPINDQTYFINEDGTYWDTFSYHENMGIFENFIKELFVRNQDKFKSENEIKEIFKKSLFTGDLLQIGKLVDKTFGKGTLRRLGEVKKKF